MTVSGVGFQSGALLSIGGVPATGVQVLSSHEIDAYTPSLSPGSILPVTVTNPGLFDATLLAGWVSDFLDVPQSDPLHPYVEKIFRNGITSGCGNGDFCPGTPVTRAQMAVFLLKAEHGSTYVPPPCASIFLDVPCPSAFADWIEDLYIEGITGGCGGANYCPASAVTRAQIAAFLLKTEHGFSYVPPACTGIFGDVPCPGTFSAWIEELYAEGVTSGCQSSPLLYCPESSVSRGQMAVFLVKTFRLP